MLSNGGFYLGKLLSNPEIREDSVKILKILLKRHTKVLDRQLSSSQCSEHVIQLFFDESDKYRQFVIDLFSNTVCIREQMENDEFIHKLLESHIPERIRMLAAFSQTAWGRASLRTSGALDILINRLSNSKDNQERSAIVNSFRHLIHYTAGMRHLSENIEFVNTVVKDVNNYVKNHQSNCKPTIDLEFVTKLSQKLEILSSSGENSGEKSMENEERRLYKDFYTTSWSYSTPNMSPKGMGSSSNSPYYFSPSPSYSCPSSSASSGANSPKIRRSEGILDDLSDIESDHDIEPIIENKTEKSIVETELWLLGFQSQDDHNLQFLVRPDVVDCVISYLRNTFEPDFRLYRILRRMATLRANIHLLIDMQFHVRVLNCLCAAPCRLLKYAKHCKQCEGCSEHGKEILREFARHVDSSYGDAHINAMFNNLDFVDRTKAAIAKVVLVKERIRVAKIPAVSELFESLGFILESPENFDKFGNVKTYENGPTLCSQIIGALSTLITGQKIKDLCEKDSWYFPGKSEDQCEIKAENNEDSEQLKFISISSNENIETAPMCKICEKSEYFQGMFSSNFVEKTENIRNFEIDSDPETFRIFVHLLLGCSGICSTVVSAEQCANLLELSDRYLCPELSTTLCADNGPLRTFLTGQTLSILLPVALITNAHPTLLSTVYLTLVRFSSSSDVTKSLEFICKNTNPIVINTFMTSFRQFLMVD
ncbi:unnamed protein product [Caenorhabditis angaria]|uniref:BTB domain-containing protein n=1 Tax=Caenorhabditis angaria TaxID=860376 RepID=A0A9P1I716_9PELO|nr:unnamed protein product [Caenorhabditis angaria]